MPDGTLAMAAAQAGWLSAAPVGSAPKSSTLTVSAKRCARVRGVVAPAATTGADCTGTAVTCAKPATGAISNPASANRHRRRDHHPPLRVRGVRQCGSPWDRWFRGGSDDRRIVRGSVQYFRATKACPALAATAETAVLIGPETR